MVLTKRPTLQASSLLNGYMNGNRQSHPHNDSSRAAHRQDIPPAANALGIKGSYPHLKDLQETAHERLRGYGTFMPVRTLLGYAKAAVDRVSTDVTYKRPHTAYVEYIVGSTLLLDLIPRHKDFTGFRTDRTQWGRMYNILCKDIDSQNSMMQEIKNTIIEDNLKNCTRPGTDSVGSNARAQSPMSLPSGGKSVSPPIKMTSRPSSSRGSDELFIDATPNADWSAMRQKPVVRPKPEALQSRSAPRVNSPKSIQDDTLSQRFSQLRIQQRNGLQERSGSVERRNIPSIANTTQNDVSVYPGPLSQHPSTESKPSGPRPMPLTSEVPLLPPKTPLDQGSNAALPRAPSPAYDPSRTQSASVIKDTGKPYPQSTWMEAGRQNKPLSARKPSVPRNAVSSSPSISRRSSIASGSQPIKTCITAAELYEALRVSNILVIDARDRAAYDEGHVQARSIMCIEPLALKPGTSAEDLEDRLVVSPESEMMLFERRNEFDLIVYYDQQTQSDRFLQGPPTRTEANALRALHDTLYEFNDYKPLRKPPLMLKGGLDAWTDLVGPRSLVSSKTAGVSRSSPARKAVEKTGRPLGRVPMASANSSLEVRKRRLREQNTLDADQEQQWLEKAKNEEVNPQDYQQNDPSADSDSDDQAPPYIHSYEDFLRRVPTASAVQQSMSVATPPPSRKPPSLPPPSVPSIPSRPAPAVPRPSYSGVSGQELTQSNLPASRPSAAQYPLFTPRSTSRYLKLPQTGLINFGVTCYMNATIQCLLATIPLSQLFLDNRWRDYLQRNWKGSNGILPGIFANLIRSLWCNDCVAVKPTSIRSLCGQLKREWGEDRQQDAKEFFDFLVDCLHEDLNVNWDRTPLQPLTTEMEMQRETMAIRRVSHIEWRRYSHREESPISDLFAGQHASRLRCTVCHNTSTTYEAFYSISVEIPRSAKRRSGGGWDLHDCLRSYTQEERLAEDEMWKCPHCKCEREATKRITITRAPLFLVVHFKRFEMRKGESAKKMHTAIQFPLFGLDMGSYMVPPASQKEIQADPDYVPELATSQPFLYDAYAVMRHLGTGGNGGHYVSLVRDASKGCWRKYDDDRVTDFDPTKLKSADRLQNEQAYLVFYCRAPAR